MASDVPSDRSHASWVEQILDEQKVHWIAGDRKRAEEYIAQYPALADDAEAALDLIYQEFYLRRESGEAPAPEEYLERFPGFAKALVRQFAVDAAVRTVDDGSLDGAGQWHREPALREAALATPAASDVAIDGYEIIRELGRGGMGVVYLARNIALGRPCALKMVLAAGHASREALDRFLIEARSFAELDHPNVLKIFHVGRHAGLLFLELEYAKGGSLDAALDGTPWPARRAAELVEALARAVAEAHGRGIIHRDLKPANVLLGASGTPKIGDFGLAKLQRAESGFTRTETVLGSPSYMAPEQAQGQSKQVGPPADIYSLGAILYELLTGRPPFKAQTVLETLEQVKTREPVRPTALVQATPRDLETIALKCLEKEPQKRYASALALADDLERFQEGRPITARPVGVIGRSWRWSRRNPKVAALSGLLLATGFVAASAIMGLTIRHNRQLQAEVRRTAAEAEVARRNYQQAASAVQTMLALLEEPRFEGIPRMLELRRAEREAALAFYEQVLAQADSTGPTGSVVRTDVIVNLLDASRVEMLLGRTERARKRIERVLELVGRARRVQPLSRDHVRQEIEAWKNLAFCEKSRSRDRAIAAARRCVELAEQFVASPRATPADFELLALCYNEYAIGLYQSPRESEALGYFQKSITVRERIDPSAVPGVNARIGESLSNVGLMLWRKNEFSQAEQNFVRAEKVLVSVPAADHHRGVVMPVSLAVLYGSWSGMLYWTGRNEEAIAKADAGLRAIEPYLQSEPDDAVARENCRNVHGNRALALSALQRHRESAAEWAKVVEFSREPVRASYRLFLAVELTRCGETERAVAETRIIKDGPDVTPEDRYNIGCVYARAAEAAQNDLRLKIDERQRRAASHIADALRWLKSAADKGFFQDSAARDYAQKDPDLAILIDRPEFREIIGTGHAKR